MLNQYKIFLLLASAFCFTNILFAQSGTDVNYCWNNGITTGTAWNAPSSPNTWNWTIPGNNHPVYTGTGLSTPSFYIELPYFCSAAVGTGFCPQENTFSYQLASVNGQLPDIYPIDGWELIVKNFGTPNSSPTANDGVAANNPYFVLYNKYTGKMKVFIAQVGDETANNAYIKVSLREPSLNASLLYRDLFGYAEPITKPLKSFNSDVNYYAPNKIVDIDNATTYYWMVAELDTKYDPCTCSPIDNKQAVIDIKLVLANTVDLKATVEGYSESGIMVNGSFQPQSNGQISFGSAVKAAVKGYTDWNSYAGFATGFLGGLESKKKKKVVDAWFKQEYSGDYQLYGTLTDAQREAMYSSWLSQGDNAKKGIGLKNAWGLTKDIVSYAPYAGIAVGLIDHLTGGDQVPPTVTHTKMTIEGTLNEAYNEGVYQFLAPGTTGTSISLGSSFWKSTLGVFNLLENPTMEYADFPLSHDLVNVIGDVNLCLLCPYPPIYGSEIGEMNNQKPRQYRLNKEVKYLINPSSNLDVDWMDACFVFEYTGADFLSLVDPGGYNNTKAIPFHHEMGNDILSLENRIAQIEATGLRLEHISPGFAEGDATKTISFATPYMPLQCLSNTNFVLFGGLPPEVHLKIVAKFKQKDNPSKVYSNVYTFDVSESFEQNKLIYAGGNNGSGACEYSADYWCAGVGIYCSRGFNHPRYETFTINSLPFNNPFYTANTNITYSGQSNLKTSAKILINNTVIPNGAILTAYGGFEFGTGVTIGNNVQFISGVQVTLPTGYTMPIGSSIVIQPNVARLFYDCTNDNIAALRASDSEITSICQSTTYRNNAINTRLSEPSVPTQPNETSNMKFNCYPNPFNQQITVAYDLAQSETVSITIKDILGHVVAQPVVSQEQSQGVYKFDVNLSEYPNGIYFVTLQTNNVNKVVKILKQE